MMIDRAVAGPELPHHVEIFARAAVAVVLGQEVTLAGLVRVAGAGDDMQRHPPLRELVEGRDLPRGKCWRYRSRPVRDQELDPLGMVGGIKCNRKTFGGRGVISNQNR